MPPPAAPHYRARMLRRPAAPARALDTAADLALAGLTVALATVAVWVQPDPVGTPVAGPLWLTAAFPLLLGVPLAWRRRLPLLALAVPMAAVVVQALVTGDSPEGLELILAIGVGGYSVGAHSPRRVAVTGLGLALAGYAVYAVENHDIRSGRAGDLWAGSFFLVALVAAWLLGVVVRTRREDRARRAQAAEAREQAERVARDERSRLARELHDVISHTLSVVVLQASGARAAGTAGPDTLQKIETSGRESLAEMRRLLDVLRRDDAGCDLAPQPGVADLEPLARQLTEAGLPVDLTVDDAGRQLTAGLGVSVYRIVQESLTNVLKHGGQARARVAVHCTPDAVTVDVEDDGTGTGTGTDTTGGLGLIGMRERVATFGGELTAGPRPEGGFAVHARLPRGSRTP
jgi:signal transduction histidine kinase